MRKRFVTNKRDKITTIKRILLWIIICGIAIGSWEENVYAQGFVPRYSAPDTSNSYYYSNNNPLYAAGYGMPNCTAYAYGRAYEILGTKPNLSTGNAGRWWTYNISSGAYGYSETVPQIGSVVCWDNNDSNTGHVAVVEKIENGIVTISMSNYGGEIFQVCTFSTSNPTMLTDVSTGSTFRATTGNTRFLGYIYILPNSLFGSLDYIAADAGIVHVSGWVMDMANMSKSIEAHVYVGGPAESYGASGVERFVVTANSERTDIETAYPGAGNYHGYQASLATSLSGEQPVYVYALNTDTGLSAHIATSSVTIPAQAVPTSVSLNKATATLTAVGETTQLTATIAPTNAVDKSVSWKSSNTSVATVSSTGLVTAVGNGTATITVTTTSGSKTATCKVTVEIPTVDANGWCYVSTLPSGVTSSSYEIQYQNIYEKYATSSPGTDWKDTGTDKTEYVASGDTYISYGLPLTTSNTVKLVDTFYYHFCSGSTSNWVNYAQTTTYTHYDELKSDSVYEYSSSPDGEDNRYTSYYLKWSNGSDAYCSTANGTCDGSNGTHGERSQYWYKAYVYQNYVAQTLNLYRKTGDWTTTKDSSATSVNYRYRLKITGVTLSKTGATLTSKGETLQLTTTVTPIDATNKSVTWTSSNTSVATVSSSGLVTAVGNGTATITATAVAGGKTATCKVTVSIAPIGVTLDKTTATLTSKGATTQLTATVAPTNAADKTVTWKSSDTSVATVSSSGLVTAVGNGTATITVTTNTSSKTATCKVTVNIAVTGVTLDKTTATLTKARETLQLTATVSPATAANKNVTWTSSDTSVATVSQDGLVTAVGIGTCTITATAADGSGKYATCEITIKGNTYEVPIQYTISFLGNGHTSGTMESLTNCISDETYELPANTFAKTGHTFIGWNTSADGSGTTYSDKESVENLSSEDGATVTLYAQWKPNTYTITFDPVGGRTDTTQKTVIYAETYGDLPIPTIVGGTFLGWYTDAQGGTQVTATDVVNITEDQTLYAHWELVYETAAPTASIPNGSEVEVGTKVSLTSETNGAQIYYTTDVTIGGNVSSETGTLYEEAITITEDVTIYAIAVKSGYKNSEVMTISYTVKDEVQDWGDITEEDRAELGFITTADIPNELWVAGAFDCDYTGKAIIYPGLHVYNYKTLLQPKVDYTIKYTNNTKAGTATITITGKGNYAGTIVKTFAIRPLDLSKATILNVTVPYTGKVQKATTTVTYLLDGKIVTLKSGTDFTYTYPGTDSKAQDYDSNAFKAAGNYTVVLNGKGNYTGTATFTQTITEKQIIGKMRLSKITNQKYTGSAITPTILLKNGKTSLIEGTDYTVAYSNNVEVGTATITITGIGDYIGTKMATFKITGTALSKAKLNSFATSLPWTGSPVTQNAMLTYTVVRQIR